MIQELFGEVRLEDGQYQAGMKRVQATGQKTQGTLQSEMGKTAGATDKTSMGMTGLAGSIMALAYVIKKESGIIAAAWDMASAAIGMGVDNAIEETGTLATEAPGQLENFQAGWLGFWGGFFTDNQSEMDAGWGKMTSGFGGFTDNMLNVTNYLGPWQGTMELMGLSTDGLGDSIAGITNKFTTMQSMLFETEMPSLVFPPFGMPEMPTFDPMDLKNMGMGDLPKLDFPDFGIPSITWPEFKLPGLKFPDFTFPDITKFNLFDDIKKKIEGVTGAVGDLAKGIKEMDSKGIQNALEKLKGWFT